MIGTPQSPPISVIHRRSTRHLLTTEVIMHTNTIAIIADDPSLRHTMRSTLSLSGYAVLEYDSSMLEVPPTGADAICLGIGAVADLALMKRLQAANPDLPVVVTGPVELANITIEEGAYEFIAMPLDGRLFRRTVAHAVEKHQLTIKVQKLSSELANRPGADDGEVVPLRELERQAIGRALKATNGSVTKAAKLLGIGRATLYRRLASPEMASLRPQRGYTPAHQAPSIQPLSHSPMVATSDPR